MKTNYYLEMTKQINGLEKREKLLLHSCCAVCSTSVIETLEKYFDLTVFYYNPNVYPKEEYEKRLSEQKRYLSIVGIPYIEGDYDRNAFLDSVCGLEGEKEGGLRCDKCIKLRLLETVKKAKELSFPYFTTTLSVSPLKNANSINAIGKDLEKEFSVLFLQADFKKKEGYKRSNEISKEYNIYRQHYCGCEFSFRKDDIEEK